MTKEEKDRVNKCVKQIAHGDINAFDDLYNTMHDVLFCFLKIYESDYDKINDIINDTFKIVIDKASEKMFFVNCSSWIIQIAKMVRLNYNKKRVDYVVVDELPENIMMTMPQDDTVLDLKESIKLLPKRDQQILYLVYYCHLKYKEVQVILNISKSTVDRSIKYSLSFIKEKLHEEQ
ncbi:MAG: sigma-70 family RNA polymerase sigma factor [Clostridia bacterium]|nr:sigma-70 family RNA polymerase sigma factor [Clostridia bacterium]